MDGTRSMMGYRDMHTKFCSNTFKGRDSLGDPEVNGSKV
jgi:hypothetical protein